MQLNHKFDFNHSMFGGFEEKKTSVNFHTQTFGISTTPVQQSSNSVLSLQTTKYLSTIFSFHAVVILECDDI